MNFTKYIEYKLESINNEYIKTTTQFNYDYLHIIECFKCKKEVYCNNLKNNLCKKCKSNIKINQKCHFCKKFKAKENNYCGKHQIQYWKKIQEENGFRVCTNYIRGCKNTLDIYYKYKKCMECLNNIKLRIYDIKKGAKKRNLEISLTDNEIINLISMKCYYCCDKSQSMGIDRMDNNLGYTIENSYPCCSICNNIKYVHNYEDFIMYCTNILNNYSTIKISENNYNKKYSDLKYKAGLRKIKFELSKEEFDKILINSCNYCNNTNSKKNNIDRINSEDHYHINNVVACCSICNLMKNNIDIKLFIDKLKKIIDNKKSIMT